MANAKPIETKSKRMFTDALTLSTVTGVSKPTPLNWFKAGGLPGVKVGNVVRFPIPEVARILGIDPESLTPNRGGTR